MTRRRRELIFEPWRDIPARQPGVGHLCGVGCATAKLQQWTERQHKEGHGE